MLTWIIHQTQHCSTTKWSANNIFQVHKNNYPIQTNPENRPKNQQQSRWLHASDAEATELIV
jgi:hypothetical protein